ncbi:helix-turn-helix domain-containing protein [Clostridium botulinum]|uniref:helix-turn-helix domain-containing protein n=1 Tax=Clostridium botulinum TaxID=1491 RepID=UPI000773C4D6|nr:helix-turn-helix domain-containing protein [Clostridium botulinum]
MENKVKDSIGMKTPFFQTPNNIFDEEFMINETTKDGVRKRYLKSFEKLVLIYLCRCGNNGQAIFPGYGDIAKKCCISRRSAINAIEILKENNFITKEKRFKKDEKINASNQYTINLDLLMPKKSGASDAPPISAHDALPLVHDIHSPSAPDAPKKELYKNNNIKNNIEQIWSLYPNKKGKAIAIKKIPKLLKQYGYEQIERCVKRYAKEKQGAEPKYIQHGSTFFNGGYMDYLDSNYKETKENIKNKAWGGKNFNE